MELQTRFNTTPQGVLFGMLVASGAEPYEAFATTHTARAFSVPGLKREADQLLKDNPGIKKLIASLKREADELARLEAEEARRNGGSKARAKILSAAASQYTDKGVIIAEMSEALSGLTGKDKIDALMKIADLQQMKKEETQTEEERVIYYLPLRCNDCALMAAKKRASKGGGFEL